MTPRCRLTIHLPHRELWLWRCTVLRALGLPQTGEVPRRWEWYYADAAEVRDTRTLTVVVHGEPHELEDTVRHALWWTLAPGHRGLVGLVQVEPIHVERSEEGQPAPLTRIEEEAA